MKINISGVEVLTRYFLVRKVNPKFFMELKNIMISKVFINNIEHLLLLNYINKINFNFILLYIVFILYFIYYFCFIFVLN